jgi:hypothetical protein
MPLAVLSSLSLLALEAPPSFTVDLSQPPRSRWKGALARVLRAHGYEHSFGPIFDAYNASLFSKLPLSSWDQMSESIDTHYPVQAEELHGIADDFAANGHPEVSYRYLVGWVWFHELSHTSTAASASADNRECTGLLARDASGRTVHVANMDQSPAQVRNATLRVSFVREPNGTTVFQGVDWYWFTTGVSRAVRAGVASIQENWRYSASPLPLDQVLRAISSGPAQAVPQIWVFRAALLTEPPMPWADMSAHLESVPLAAPFYVVAAGPAGEGVVMARNQTASVGTAVLSDTLTVLVQTNYDRWQPDPKFDPRRTRAEEMLQSVLLGSGTGHDAAATALDLLAVASAYPVHNPHTAFTAVMDPATGALRAYVRDALCPINGGSQPTVADRRYCQKKTA